MVGHHWQILKASLFSLYIMWENGFYIFQCYRYILALDIKRIIMKYSFGDITQK